VGRTGQVIFFVMKLVRGGSLATLVEGGGRLPPSEIRRILVESGKALNYAAEKGIVHRDIKPDNIMFDEHGASVITDFGIAKAASGQRLTSTGMSIGTPHYMSPEQARAQDTDGRSDIYSLGVVAYQALLGEVPYDGEDSFSIGYKHIMEPIPEPVLSTPDERRLYTIIRKMLAKDPADRFQTGLDLVEEIEGRPSAPRRISGATTRERLAAMPTTPIPKETVDALRTSPPARTSGPSRPAMRRSAASRELGQKKSGRFLVWLIVAAVIAAGGLFGAGKLGLGPLARDDGGDAGTRGSEFQAAGGDAGTPGSGIAAVADSGAQDTTGQATTAVDSSASPLAGVPADTSPLPRLPASPPTSAGPPGFLRIVGLPKGTTVLVDDVAPDSTPIRLSPGPHIVAISAPQHVFYVDTVNIRSALELTFTPLLTPLGEPLRTERGGTQTLGPVDTSVPTCDRPGPGYNKDQLCWDVRPLPVLPPRVPVPATLTPLPGPVVLLVKVNADGTTAEVGVLRPSDSEVFNGMATDYAAAMRWRPATKAGAAVVAWTQVRLEAIHQ
jgi:hypothetical protein